jgi:hypothetical protein
MATKKEEELNDCIDSNSELLFKQFRKYVFNRIPVLEKSNRFKDNDALINSGINLKGKISDLGTKDYIVGCSSLCKVFYAQDDDGEACAVRLYPKLHLAEFDKLRVVDSLIQTIGLVEHENVIRLQQVMRGGDEGR